MNDKTEACPFCGMTMRNELLESFGRGTSTQVTNAWMCGTTDLSQGDQCEITCDRNELDRLREIVRKLPIPMTDEEATEFGQRPCPTFIGNCPIGDVSIDDLNVIVAWSKKAERYLASKSVQAEIRREKTDGHV